MTVEFSPEEKLFVERAVAVFGPELPEHFRVYKKETRVALALADFEFFCRYYLAHHFTLPAGEFHKFMFSDAQGILALKGERFLLEVVFRGGTKTTVFALGLPLWTICFEKRHFILLISDSMTQAKEKGTAIKNEIENNERILEDFGPLIGSRWAEEEFQTANNIKVVTLGTGMNPRGRKHHQYRPDLIILDDIENQESVRSPTQRRKTLAHVHSDIFKAGSYDAKYIIIGTYLSYDCVLKELAESPIFWRRRNWPVIERVDGAYAFASKQELWEQWADIITNLADYDREARARKFYEAREEEMLEGTRVAWPERFSYYDLMLMRLADPASFSTEMLNEPNDPLRRFFRYKTYRKIWNWQGQGEGIWLVPWGESGPSGRPAVPLSQCELVAATDPSMGQSMRSDYSAIIIIARAPFGQMFVLEADIERRTPDQIIQRQIFWYQQYPQITRWTIESNQFQGFFATRSGQESLAVTAGLPLVPTPQNNAVKAMRIESLQPDLENGYILLLDGDTEQVLLKRQLENYPNTSHDDGPDALEMARTLSNQRRETSNNAVTLATSYQFLAEDEPWSMFEPVPEKGEEEKKREHFFPVLF